jgi:uncharacterized protein YbjQ (UPF0145 family)
VEEKVTDKVGRKHIRMNLKITFHPQLPPWTVTNERTYTQDDDFNSGPIVCLNVMEIYGLLRNGSIDQIHQSGNSYWSVVMEYYKSPVIKYANILKAELHTKSDAKKQQGAEYVSTTDVPATLLDLKSLLVTRANAMEKKNTRQRERAMKEMKRCGAAALELGAAPGAVVTLKVDYRTHSHAQGLIAIVYEVKETGGILVCFEHGVIIHSGTPGDYWVHVDKYKVVARMDEVIPLTRPLQATRDLVLSGNFQPGDYRRISYGKLHEKSIEATSPPRRQKGCGCKHGICVKACSCRKKGVSCHSGCSCNGNCVQK